MVKVKRSFPAPASLGEEAGKLNGSYAQQDVIERLMTDFNGKCYICELKEYIAYIELNKKNWKMITNRKGKEIHLPPVSSILLL